MPVFEKRYQNLNNQQKEAVDAIDGPVMVIAGPGSGKTELLGLRAANILRKTDADPSDILCLTFTDAAAHNMRERLAGLIGKDAYKVAIHTFHSFGSEIINHHPECFYQGAVYSPIDEITKIEILEKIVKGLKWNSKLKGYHPSQGYTYLADIKSRIDDIKKGGLSPQDFEELILENQIFEVEANRFINTVFAERISAKTIESAGDLIAQLEDIKVSERKNDFIEYGSEKEAVIESLKYALAEVESVEEKKSQTKPLTEWKKNFLKKNAKGQWLLESSFKNKDLLDLAKIYTEYQKEIHSEGFYDFSDMILDTVRELENNQELRYEVQEKFLYVMVDEFQDTNGVQMRLLDSVLNKEINEGRPNILVVGDDDQSIYKFQGANMQNVINFLHKYDGVKKIVLTQNYRSTQEILEYSKEIICRSEDRLEKKDSSIVKDLVCANSSIGQGKILQREFNHKIEQYIFIAEEIKKIRKGAPEGEVAIIARNHSDLEDISRLLNFYDIPVSYERNKNILESKHIEQIITIAKFIDSLNRKGREQADEYLPEILSFEFFGLDRLEIWKISSSAHKGRGKNWLEVMLEFGGQSKEIAEFLIALGTESKRKTMEEILDFITGVEKIEGANYQSNFKNHYFSKENFEGNRLEYLEYLFDLQTLFVKLREYKSKQTLYIRDLVEFIDLYEIHKLSIYKTQRLNKGKNPVNLMTAHKAKGLEFDSVFIINCNEETWIKSRNHSKLQLPVNIPLTPEKDSIDDRIRLFFVAVTRAKRNLFLTNYEAEDGAKKVLERLRFLDKDLKTKEIETIDKEEIRTQEEIINFKEELRRYRVQNVDEEILLKSILEDYKLSATHLNNFLDVTNGGPATFLERNLLHFPEAQNASSSYGTAVHNSFTEFYKRFKEKGKMPNQTEFLKIFEEKLKLQKLNEKDFAEKLEQGKEELGFYFENSEKDFCIKDSLAISFKNEGVTVSEAHITGEIDRISFADGKNQFVKVFDYKTGKPFDRWDQSDPYLKVKSFKYKDQLVFYKILIENSRSFNKTKVISGGIDFIKSQDGELVKLEMEISEEEVEKMKALIEIVYEKIMNLDFPDISKYSSDLKGVEEFKDDLLSGRV
jgi:DNA helicase-2/ATP-dependent DNA helicase PcrA